MQRNLFYGAIVVAGGMFAGMAMAGNDHTYGSSSSAMGQSTQSTQGQTSQRQAGQAQQRNQGHASFDQIDTNGDGYISQSEWKQSGAFQVDESRLDTNNDGRLNRSEFAAFEQAHNSRPYSSGNPGYGNSSYGQPNSGTQRDTDRYQQDSPTDHMPQ